MPCMETIAVTKEQSAALLAAAKRRAKNPKAKGAAAAYFKRVEGAVPQKTDTGSSCAGHRLVRVVRGLRERAGIKHKSLGKVHFAPKTKLARKHPRGVACFMKWKWTSPAAPEPPAGRDNRHPDSRVLRALDGRLRGKRKMEGGARTWQLRTPNNFSRWKWREDARRNDAGEAPISMAAAKMQYEEEGTRRALAVYSGHTHNAVVPAMHAMRKNAIPRHQQESNMLLGQPIFPAWPAVPHT
jgi:hypothetical protein